LERVISEGDNIYATLLNFVSSTRIDPGATCRVFAINNNEISAQSLTRSAHPLLKRFTSRPTNDITEHKHT
jgi:hypothetical protein